MSLDYLQKNMLHPLRKTNYNPLLVVLSNVLYNQNNPVKLNYDFTGFNNKSNKLYFRFSIHFLIYLI